MADEPPQPGKESEPRRAREKRRPADSLLEGKKNNTIELDEADLRKVSGGVGYVRCQKK
jgi:hypothetical protein